MNDSAVLLLGEIKYWSLLGFKEFTLYLTEMINMKLLLIISLHNPQTDGENIQTYQVEVVTLI